MEPHDSEGKISSSLAYKLVPWVNWDEWNYVRRSIFSSSPILISAALQKISAWESRGCLPIAVDLTAVIIEIHQKDPFFRGDSSIGDALASEKMLNMLYCMFIMRLVNDFVEPTQKETGHSISDLAEAVGIPRTLVDIRHESSHRCLPSLKLARSASAKALEWLKDNYWEPQRIAIQNPRSKVKSKLREMILCLTSHHFSRVNSRMPKRKCSKRATLLVARHKLSNLDKRLLASKSDVSTVQIVKLTKRAAHLYSLYPSEVVSSLLEIYLSQAGDISDDIDMKHTNDVKLKPVAGALIDLKMVITKLFNKKPRLLLDMLKVVLEMIEEKDSTNYETDRNHFPSSQNHVEINQVFHLRSLFLFLVRNLKALKESGQIGLVEEKQFLSTDNIAAPKVLLSNLLRRCLTLLVPGDNHLCQSVLLLSEMSGNRLLTEKLKKLPLINFPDQDLDSLTTLSYNESMLLKEEDSIKKAEERLNHIKLRLLNGKIRDARHMNGNADATTRRWTVTKSWVACPIGMLPCSFSSTAVLPILDVMEVEREMDKSEKTSHNVEIVCPAEKNEIVCDDNEPSDDGNPVKKLKQTPQHVGSLAPENPFPMQGRLLMGGMWQKVCEEELVSLEADVSRIFV